MKLPAIRNATLTAVTGPGFSPDADQPGTTGAAKWTGSEEVFMSERAQRVNTAGRTDIVIERAVVVDSALAVSFAIGDTLALTYEGNARSVVVRRVGRTVAPGLAGVTRLVLEDG